MKLKYEQKTIDLILQRLDNLNIKGIQNNIIVVDIYNILTQQCEQEEEKIEE